MHFLPDPETVLGEVTSRLMVSRLRHFQISIVQDVPLCCLQGQLILIEPEALIFFALCEDSHVTFDRELSLPFDIKLHGRKMNRC